MLDKQDQQNLKQILAKATPALLVLLGLKPSDQVTWDIPAGRFRINGRLVTVETTRKLIRQIEDLTKANAQAVTEDLLAGRISLDAWETKMKANITTSHWASAALFVGGLAAAATLGVVTRRITQEFKFLGNFRLDLRAGKVSNAKAVARAKSYSMAGNVTGQLAEFDYKKNPPPGGKKYRKAKRVRTAAESCAGCIEWAGKWYPIDEMPPIGSLQCGSHCRCFIIFI